MCTHYRSGKSSISKVVFHKLSPNETLFLESTSKVVKDDINNSSFVQFQVSFLLYLCVCSYDVEFLARFGTFLVKLTSLIQLLTLNTFLVDVVL